MKKTERKQINVMRKKMRSDIKIIRPNEKKIVATAEEKMVMATEIEMGFKLRFRIREFKTQIPQIVTD